jgi:hypothetical protein
MVQPQPNRKCMEPRPSERITFPSANQIGCRSDVRLWNVERSPLIELEAPESQSQMSVTRDSLERKRVATPAVSWVFSALVLSFRVLRLQFDDLPGIKVGENAVVTGVLPGLLEAPLESTRSANSSVVLECAAFVLMLDSGVLAKDVAIADSVNHVSRVAILVLVSVGDQKMSALRILRHLIGRKGNAEKSSEEATETSTHIEYGPCDFEFTEDDLRKASLLGDGLSEPAAQAVDELLGLPWISASPILSDVSAVFFNRSNPVFVIITKGRYVSRSPDALRPVMCQKIHAKASVIFATFSSHTFPPFSRLLPGHFWARLLDCFRVEDPPFLLHICSLLYTADLVSVYAQRRLWGSSVEYFVVPYSPTTSPFYILLVLCSYFLSGIRFSISYIYSATVWPREHPRFFP